MYAVILIIFLFVWALVSSILFTLFYKNKHIDKLKYYDDEFEIKEKYANNKKDKSTPLKQASKIVPHFKFNKKGSKRLENDLMKANIPITVEELLIIKIFSSTAFAFLAYALSKDYIIVIAVFILIWNIPKLIISSRKKTIIKQFDSQLKEGIMIISNSLKAGYSFLQAISVVAEETKDPFSKEFKKLIKEMSLGITEEDSLKNLLMRVESEDLRLVINAILIQKDTGGNLAEILDNIAETIMERQKIKNELKTLTAQGKLSGTIVMLIPIFLGIVIYFFNKEYMMLLFTTSTGLIMVTTSVMSEILGFIMIKKIVNIDV